MSDTPSTQWLTPAQVSTETGIPERTLSQWRYLGKGPRFARFGRHVRYSRVDLGEWTAAQLAAVDASREAKAKGGARSKAA